MSDVLEILQWAAILFLGVMVFGLTRQLGFFLIPRHEQLRQQGPKIGAVLGSDVFDEIEQRRIRDAIATGPTLGAVLLIVDERCSGCAQLVGIVEEWSAYPRATTLVALVKESGPAFRDRLAAVVDVTFDDSSGAKTRAAGIVATPYLLMIDQQLRVEDAEVGGHIEPLIASWFDIEGSAEEPHTPVHVIQPPEVSAIAQGGSPR